MPTDIKPDSRFAVRLDVGESADAILVVLFVLFQYLTWIFFRAFVNQVMTRRTQEHEIVDIVDVFRSRRRPPARPVGFESDNVRHLGEVLFGVSEVVPEQVGVATVEFATSASAHAKKKSGFILDGTRWELYDR